MTSRHLDARISSQGQVTVPVHIRRRLGLTAGSTVTFVIDDEDHVRFEKPKYTLEEVFGSVPGIPGTSDDLDDEIEAAIAKDIAERYGPPVSR